MYNRHYITIYSLPNVTVLTILELEREIFGFKRGDKKYKVKRYTLVANYNKGGLNMTDI